jgi:hypothetical protein
MFFCFAPERNRDVPQKNQNPDASGPINYRRLGEQLCSAYVHSDLSICNSILKFKVYTIEKNSSRWRNTMI